MGYYLSYDSVPAYRQQWFFWLTFFFVPPLALLVLITGDVYYRVRGEVRAFGWLNRGLAVLILLSVISSLLRV